MRWCSYFFVRRPTGGFTVALVAHVAFLFALAGLLTLASCGGTKHTVQQHPHIRLRREKLPRPSPPPSCVKGELVTPARVCGLGIAGRAYRWNDERMRANAKERAAENLAGMIRTIVVSAMENEQTDEATTIRYEHYLEINDALVDEINNAADHEIWFDVAGKGPFRVPQLTYACACVDTSKVRIKIDTRQAAQHAIAHQSTVDEVPAWITQPLANEGALRCAVGSQGNMFFTQDMYQPLTDSVRANLVGATKSTVVAESVQNAICAGDDCQTRIRKSVGAVNKGVSRGVVLTGMWLDAKGIKGEPNTAYALGCVFDRALLDRARAQAGARR